jgi:phosphoenolpyruvate synthase/pyruvate phosphate dikinase
VEVGLEVESAFGMPQDIEWAFESDELVVLQSRPITA